MLPELEEAANSKQTFLQSESLIAAQARVACWYAA